MGNSIIDLFNKQILILYQIKMELDMTNFLFENKHKLIPKHSRDLNIACHSGYRNTIIGLSALFSNRKNVDKNNFHRFYNDDSIASQLENSKRESIKNILLLLEDTIQIIARLRDKEFAHYDFENDIVIKINYDYLPELKNLFKKAKEILDIAMKDIMSIPDSQFTLS